MIPIEPTDPAFDRFRDRVDAYCSDLISADEFSALEAELVASESARRYFVDYLQLHAELGFATRTTRAAALALDRFNAATASAAVASPRFAGKWVQDRSRRWVTVQRVGLGAAAAAAVGLVVAGLTFRRPVQSSSPVPVAVASSAAIPISVPGNVAWLINAQNCQWAQGDEIPGRDMTVGKILSLDRGLAEVEFARGARVILQGPAALELLSDNMARLTRGAMTARVPVAAHGFTVFSPQGKVVDLGTEFGLAVDTAGITSVRVFSGELTAASGQGSRGEIRLSEGQEARIDGQAVSVRANPSQAEDRFARAIVLPPEIRPRSLPLDFRQVKAGSLLDGAGMGIGLTRRLPGTGSSLANHDPNLRLRTDLGVLELTTTRSDLNMQVAMGSGEYLGVPLRSLGFTGPEDFTISAEIAKIPTLDVVGQFGLYAGVRSDRAIRGGVLRQPEAERYSLFLVNNGNGIDQDVNELGLTTTGDDLRFTLRRIAGDYSLVVENLTRQSSSTLTIPPSRFLDGVTDLDVGLFGANTQSNLQKTLTIKQVEITVFTQNGVATALARNPGLGNLAR